MSPSKSTTSNETGLDFYREHALLDKILAYLSIALISLSWAIVLFGGIVVLWLVSAQLRVVLDSNIWSAVVLFTLLVVAVLFETLSLKLGPRILNGKSVFGRLGGLPKRHFRAAMKAQSTIAIEFFNEDKPLVDRFCHLDYNMMHDQLYTNYMRPPELYAFGAEWPDPEKWDEVWKRIRSVSVREVNFGEVLSSRNVEFAMAVGSTIQSRMMLPPLGGVFALS